MGQVGIMPTSTWSVCQRATIQPSPCFWLMRNKYLIYVSIEVNASMRWLLSHYDEWHWMYFALLFPFSVVPGSDIWYTTARLIFCNLYGMVCRSVAVYQLPVCLLPKGY